MPELGEVWSLGLILQTSPRTAPLPGPIQGKKKKETILRNNLQTQLSWDICTHGVYVD
jgi:hypothetical protein